MWSPLRDYNYPVHRLLAGAARRHLGDFHGRVLDVGCGTSPYRDYLPAGVDYVGVDRAVAGPAVRARADMAALPFLAASFDGALCTEVLEQSPRPWAIVAELARVLRPGGRLYLTAPFDWHFVDEPYDYFRFTTHGLRALVEDAGFRVEAVEPVGGLFTALAGKLVEEVVQDLWLPTARAAGIKRGAYLVAALASLPWNLASSALLPWLDRLSARNPFAIATRAVRA
jgi:SAM-dependent methyltransferase